MAVRGKSIRKQYKKKGRKIVQAKKIVIDGIQFQSLLEGSMYRLLRDADVEFEYEGVVLTTFEEFNLEEDCWERATRRSKQMINRKKVKPVTYTPDFVGKNQEWFIEVKGRANESFPIRWKLFKETISKRKVKPLIFKPMNVKDCEQVIEILREKNYARN